MISVQSLYVEWKFFHWHSLFAIKWPLNVPNSQHASNSLLRYLAGLYWYSEFRINSRNKCYSKYTVRHKKWCHFYFYDNFGKCEPILIILSLLDSAEYGNIKSSTAPEFCCRTTLWNLNVQWHNVSFNAVWTYLHKQQMSELPSMTVFQVLSLLEPCYER